MYYIFQFIKNLSPTNKAKSRILFSFIIRTFLLLLLLLSFIYPCRFEMKILFLTIGLKSSSMSCLKLSTVFPILTLYLTLEFIIIALVTIAEKTDIYLAELKICFYLMLDIQFYFLIIIQTLYNLNYINYGIVTLLTNYADMNSFFKLIYLCIFCVNIINILSIIFSYFYVTEQ